MSTINPIVVDFGVQAADPDQTVYMDFSVEESGGQVPFTLSSDIRPVIQARTYIHNQNQASDHWEIHHELNKYPSVTIVDSAKTVVIGGVQYIDKNFIICTFSHPFSGTAYLN